METDIYKIYHNSFGIAFQWIDIESKKKRKKVQLVFRDMGFYLSVTEIRDFYNCIASTKKTGTCNCCSQDCDKRSIMLATPSSKVGIAVNEQELLQLEDLIKGTLFQLDLEQYLNQVCRN
ncbi:hypothetical protein ACW5R3_01000 [Bizionia sp. KMM 8389]